MLTGGGQARLPLPDWLRRDCSREIAFFLGWLAGVVVLYTVALVLRAALDSVSLRYLLVAFVTVAVAGLAVGTKTWAAWRGDREDTAWKIEELTEWQRRLGPAIFCVH